MKKQELIEAISSRTGFVQIDVDKVMSAALQIIRETISSGEPVRINNFGVFTSRIRPKKIARAMKGSSKNPAPIILPEKMVAQFKPTKEFIIEENGIPT